MTTKMTSSYVGMSSTKGSKIKTKTVTSCGEKNSVYSEKTMAPGERGDV